VPCQDKNFNFIRFLLSQLIVSHQSRSYGYAPSSCLNLTQNISECFLNLYPVRTLEQSQLATLSFTSWHLRTLHAIRRCRTSDMGGHSACRATRYRQVWLW